MPTILEQKGFDVVDSPYARGQKIPNLEEIAN